MKIFVSWSGAASRRVAELLKDWLPHVVQRAELYVSSQDIEKGERWAASIAAKLSEIDFGIIIVTPENIDAPWVNFEAGALSKSVKSRVIPLLCGMDRIDAASSPLRQFQYALATKEEIQRLVLAVNDACDKPLEPSRIEPAFQKWWDEFEQAYGKIEFVTPKVGPKSENDTRLGKIEGALEAIMADLFRMRRDIQIHAFRPEAEDLSSTTPPRWAMERPSPQGGEDERREWITRRHADRNGRVPPPVRLRTRPRSADKPSSSEEDES
jgi:hypothetical protein